MVSSSSQNIAKQRGKFRKVPLWADKIVVWRVWKVDRVLFPVGFLGNGRLAFMPIIVPASICQLFTISQGLARRDIRTMTDCTGPGIISSNFSQSNLSKCSDALTFVRLARDTRGAFEARACVVWNCGARCDWAPKTR